MSRNFLFKYIFAKIGSSLLFFVVLCLILSELVGISFEQMRLITDDKISIPTSFCIHIFAAPKFLLMTMPYALFMANMLTYSKLSKSSEIIALFSFGISITRILMPCFIMSILITTIAFFFQELVVTESNYKTAITLEKAVNIERDITTKDFAYNQFDNIPEGKEINLLLYAKSANNKMMEDVTLLSFKHGNLHKIIIAPLASWKPKEKKWKLHQGTEERIDNFKNIITSRFEVYDLKVRNTLNQLLTHVRDDNELNILDLRRRLNIFKETGHEKEILQLERIIQDRFITPVSCIVFSLVGASIGICLQPKSANNEVGVGLVVILVYYILQFANATLIGNGSIPIWSVWMPSLFGIVFTFSRLFKFI
jgi:lipopolysaccharide export system permease protein